MMLISCIVGDIEGHKGKDGRYYLLDFSRSMPPEAPEFGYSHLHHPSLTHAHSLAKISKDGRPIYPRGVFYRMLRPELVSTYPGTSRMRFVVLCFLIIFIFSPVVIRCFFGLGRFWYQQSCQSEGNSNSLLSFCLCLAIPMAYLSTLFAGSTGRNQIDIHREDPSFRERTWTGRYHKVDPTMRPEWPLRYVWVEYSSHKFIPLSNSIST